MSKLFPRGVKRQIERLNMLSTGSGAIKFPSNVTRLELRFHKNVREPCVGAKHFWRETLPPIQFYNPQIPISVRRYNSEAGRQPELIVEFADGSLQTVDAANKPKEAILKQLIDVSGAETVNAIEQVRIGSKTQQNRAQAHA